MWILSKDRTCMINTDTVDSIYSVTTGVRARFARANKDLTIGEYESKETAKTAVEMVHESLRVERATFTMPNDEQVRAFQVAMPFKRQRSETGKKTVRRGGS